MKWEDLRREWFADPEFRAAFDEEYPYHELSLEIGGCCGAAAFPAPGEQAAAEFLRRAFEQAHDDINTAGREAAPPAEPHTTGVACLVRGDMTIRNVIDLNHGCQGTTAQATHLIECVPQLCIGIFSLGECLHHGLDLAHIDDHGESS